MNKSQLVQSISEQYNIKKKDATIAVERIFDSIFESLVRGEKVQISGFGTFETKERAARRGRNPHTKETLEIPAFKSARFTPSKTLKKAINKKTKES